MRAHIITEKNGEIKLVAGNFSFSVLSVTTDYDLPENIRYLKMMPKPEWASKPNDVREFLNTELKIADIRAQILPLIENILRQLKDEYAESFRGQKETQKLLPDSLTIDGLNSGSHEIGFKGQTYKWTKDDFERLKNDIAIAIKEIKEADIKGWEFLKSMNLNGLPVENPHGRNMASILEIGDREIVFGSPKSSLAAYNWALENGAMRIEEFKVREAIKKGAKIERVITGHGTSPDHMRQTTSYGDKVGGINLGEPNELLHKLASALIEEREKEARALEMEKMKVRIRIYESQSRTKGKVVAETEGLFLDAINDALKNVNNYGNPRRGYSVSIIRLLDADKEGRKESKGFERGSEVIEYLKNFNREILL